MSLHIILHTHITKVNCNFVLLQQRAVISSVKTKLTILTISDQLEVDSLSLMKTIFTVIDENSTV